TVLDSCGAAAHKLARVQLLGADARATPAIDSPGIRRLPGCGPEPVRPLAGSARAHLLLGRRPAEAANSTRKARSAAWLRRCPRRTKRPAPARRSLRLSSSCRSHARGSRRRAHAPPAPPDRAVAAADASAARSDPPVRSRDKAATLP